MSDDGVLGCASCHSRSFMLTSPRNLSKDSLVRFDIYFPTCVRRFCSPIQVACPEFDDLHAMTS